MSVIVNLLDQAAEKRAAAAAVRAEIEKVAGTLLEQQQGLEDDAKKLIEEAKEKAKYIPDDQRHTLVGRLIQLVWRPAAKEQRLDPGKVRGLLLQHGVDPAELDACFIEVETRKATWAEAKVGKK